MKKTMLDYIHQTPAVLEKLLRDSETQTAALTDLLCSRPWRILRLVASGSSGNAAWCARPMLRRLLGMEVLVTPPHSSGPCRPPVHPGRPEEGPAKA